MAEFKKGMWVEAKRTCLVRDPRDKENLLVNQGETFRVYRVDGDKIFLRRGFLGGMPHDKKRNLILMGRVMVEMRGLTHLDWKEISEIKAVV